MNVDAREREYAHCTVYSFVTDSYCDLPDGHEGGHRWTKVARKPDRICAEAARCGALFHFTTCPQYCGEEHYQIAEGPCTLTKGHDDAHLRAWLKNGASATPRPFGHKCDLDCGPECDKPKPTPGQKSVNGGTCTCTGGKWSKDCDLAKHRGWYFKEHGYAELREDDPESILEEANRIINGGRQHDYGDNTTPDIAQLWNVYLAQRGIREVKAETLITGRDVAVMQMLLKIVRDIHHPKRDNAVDIAGYAELMEKEPNGTGN